MTTHDELEAHTPEVDFKFGGVACRCGWPTLADIEDVTSFWDHIAAEGLISTEETA